MDEILNAAMLLNALREFPEQEIATPDGKTTAVEAVITKRRKLQIGASAVKSAAWKGGRAKLTDEQLAEKKPGDKKDVLQRRKNREECIRLRKAGDPRAICAHVKTTVSSQLRNKRKSLTTTLRDMLTDDAARVCTAGEADGGYAIACARLFSAYDVAQIRESVINEGIVEATPETIQKIAEVKELCVLAERADVIATARAHLCL